MSSPRVLTPCRDHGLKGGQQGYARFWDSATQKKMLAHRKVFRDTFGFLPPVVMHKCDNSRCIEPAHLEAGDWDKNNKDRAAKGRSAPFVTARQRFSPAEVLEIRERFAMRSRPVDLVNGVVALAREFSVDTNVIYQIASGKTYRNVA